jgi:hypothetical protein
VKQRQYRLAVDALDVDRIAAGRRRFALCRLDARPAAGREPAEAREPFERDRARAGAIGWVEQQQVIGDGRRAERQHGLSPDIGTGEPQLRHIRPQCIECGGILLDKGAMRRAA